MARMMAAFMAGGGLQQTVGRAARWPVSTESVCSLAQLAFLPGVPKVNDGSTVNVLAAAQAWSLWQLQRSRRAGRQRGR